MYLESRVRGVELNASRVVQRAWETGAKVEPFKISRRQGLLSLAGWHAAVSNPALGMEAQYDR